MYVFDHAFDFFAKAKANFKRVTQEAAGVSQGGNALSEVTAAPIDLSHIPAFQPVRLPQGCIRSSGSSLGF